MLRCTVSKISEFIMSLPHTLILPYAFRKFLLGIVLYDVKMDTTNGLKGIVHFSHE
jgi:hypothetical protein